MVGCKQSNGCVLYAHTWGIVVIGGVAVHGVCRLVRYGGSWNTDVHGVWRFVG